ncbi:hypothetical protein Ancab_033024 [Ancistrocladus abbreviatus]
MRQGGLGWWQRKRERVREGQLKEGKKEEKLVGKKRKTVEKAISKDGYDDESKLLRTIFDVNLPLKVKKKAPSKEPKKVKLIHNKINEAADTVHAYIVHKTEDSAEASLGRNMAVFGGNHIRVDRACPPRKKLKGDSSLLYDNKRTDEEICQLFYGISRLQSSIEAIRVVRDPHTSWGKGIAYVLFKTGMLQQQVVFDMMLATTLSLMVCCCPTSRELPVLEIAAASIRLEVKLLLDFGYLLGSCEHGLRTKNLKLRGQELRIYHAMSNSTPSPKRYSSLDWTQNSPAKRAADSSRTPYSGNKGKTKAATVYQGLSAIKSGMEKQDYTRTIRLVSLNSGAQSREGMKQRKHKRPAVAARKAKANGPKIVGGSNHAGKERDTESATPYSSHQKRKSKKPDVK